MRATTSPTMETTSAMRSTTDSAQMPLLGHAGDLRLPLLAIALLCGAAVSIAGPIGFIGLVVPQLIRRLVSVDLRVMVPLSALCGALVLLLADIAARTLFTPWELATGIMTALVGAPVFIFMASRMFK